MGAKRLMKDDVGSSPARSTITPTLFATNGAGIMTGYCEKKLDDGRCGGLGCIIETGVK